MLAFYKSNLTFYLNKHLKLATPISNGGLVLTPPGYFSGSARGGVPQYLFYRLPPKGGSLLSSILQFVILFLFLNIFPYGFFIHIPDCRYIIASCPEMPISPLSPILRVSVNLCGRKARILKGKINQAISLRSFEHLAYFCECLSVLDHFATNEADNLYQDVKEIFKRPRPVNPKNKKSKASNADISEQKAG